MTLKLKLTIWFTSIVAAILFGSFFIVYENYSFFRQANFYDRLEDRAHFITNTYLDAKGLDEKTIQTLNNYTLSISPNLRVTIYDSAGKLMQPIGKTIPFTSTIEKKVAKKSPFEEQINDTQYIYFTYAHAKGNVIALAAAYDKTGFSKVAYLRNLFIVILLLGIGTTALVGWWFSRYSLRPMNDVVKDVQNITAKNLHTRLTIINPNDEIGHLSNIFNQMLDRLESSFSLQKDFVSNASHEFRTPLTAIKGQIQVALLKDRNTDEYKLLLQSLNDDINSVINLLNALSELAKANADFPLKATQPVSILDVLIDAQNELIKNKPNYFIEISIDDSIDQPEKMMCLGDVSLLKSAVSNLMDNGCKFSSQHKVVINAFNKNNAIILSFKDYGVGIAPENLTLIFEPFFRANDTRNIYGHGIGLSLVKRIIEWHKGTIDVESKIGEGTIFTISLPNNRFNP